jgi:serine/threonine-protein kinase
MSEESLFNPALAISDPAERSAYLDGACGGDAALRRRIDALLVAHDNSGTFLRSLVAPVATGSFGGEPGGVLETLAASFGPNPRLLLSDTDAGSEPPVVRPAREAGADGSTRYRIDGEIARGGMGAILKGRDPDLGRDVAIKVLRDDLLGNPEMVHRFVEEAQIGGQLQHPGLVPIYELGTFADRRPFFAMKLVRGHTLAALLDGRKAPVSDLPRFLNIVEAVSQTVAYAHARGVIHRDLKPSNVMVGSFGEVQVMDWGLAKVLPRGGLADDATAGRPDRNETVISTARSGPDGVDLSRAGSVLGTPSYMAPEQARGEVERIDERADVFALGSILCEVLTGHPAFVGRTSGEIQRRAALGDTADAVARLDACGADPDLVALAKDCLAREPEDRPRTAGAVSGRLVAYRAGVEDRLRRAELARAAEAALARAAEAARAEEAEARARAERRARRMTAGLAASVLALVVVGGGGAAWLARQRQARLAMADRRPGEATALFAQARSRPEDAAAWRAALDATGRIERSDLPAPALARLDALAHDARAGAEAAEADHDLLDRVVDIRSSAQADDPDGAVSDSAYADAFRTAGATSTASAPRRPARGSEPALRQSPWPWPRRWTTGRSAAGGQGRRTATPGAG